MITVMLYLHHLAEEQYSLHRVVYPVPLNSLSKQVDMTRAIWNVAVPSTVHLMEILYFSCPCYK